MFVEPTSVEQSVDHMPLYLPRLLQGRDQRLVLAILRCRRGSDSKRGALRGGGRGLLLSLRLDWLWGVVDC